MKPVVKIDQTYKNTPGGLFVPFRNPIEVEARRSTAVAGDPDAVKSAAESSGRKTDAQLIWYSLGISVGVVLLLVLAVKAKLVKI